jgi:hypothetical protein
MNPALQKIADYMSCHRDRSAIDPAEIGASLLQHLFILEVRRKPGGTPPSLFIRLSGTALDRAFGRSVKGCCLDDFLHGPHSADVLNGFRACADNHEPLWMRQVVCLAGRLPRYVEGIAYYVEPDLIYGGLMVGEISAENSASSFESRRI